MNVLILGAASAIAQEVAKLWASADNNLFLVARNEERLQIVADDLVARGAGAVRTATADLNDFSRHQSLIQEATNLAGGVNLALIAHGSLGNQQEGEADFAAALQELTTNFLSVASLLTHLANYFEGQKQGTIVVISSVAGDRGRQSNYIYGAAKGAVTIFLQGLRNRLAPAGVRVLAVKPGLVDTPMTAKFKKGFLWASPDVVARGIHRAIRRKKDVAYVPWFWRWIMLVVRSIPEPIFKRMRL